MDIYEDAVEADFFVTWTDDEHKIAVMLEIGVGGWREPGRVKLGGWKNMEEFWSVDR